MITGKHKPRRKPRFRTYGVETMTLGDNLPYGNFLANPIQVKKMPTPDDMPLQQEPPPNIDEVEIAAMPDNTPLQQEPLPGIDEWETSAVTTDNAPLQQETLPEIDEVEAATTLDGNGSKASGHIKVRGTDIVIDANSGISVEDQREIIRQINGIAEKNRRALSTGIKTGESTGTDSKESFKATKNGGLFPVLVNFLAIVALVGGLFALYFFQNETDVQAREGTRVFNSTERAIIDEIRRETSDLLSSKDREIAILSSLLADVETQMSELVAEAEVLTPVQMASYERLRERQEVLLEALALAREDRSRILNDARSHEAVLHAQFDTRLQMETQLQEFVAIGEAPPAEQLAAYERLRIQQEELHAALIQAREERSLILGEAREREEALQAQLDERASVENRLQGLIADTEAWTPERRAAYDQLRSQQEELRDALEQAWEAHSQVLNEAREREAELQARLEAEIRERDPRAYALEPELEAAQEELARITHEQMQAERMEAMITSLFVSAHRQVVGNRFYEAEESIRSLREIINDPTFQAILAVQQRREFYVQATNTLEVLLEQNRAAHAGIIITFPQFDENAELRLLEEIARLEVEIATRDDVISTMDMAEADMAQIVAQFENTIGNLQSTNAALSAQAGNLQSANAALNVQTGNLQSANAALNTQAGNLQSANAALNTQVSDLQSANVALNTQVSGLQSTNAALNAEVSGLQSTNGVLTSQVDTLQSANTTLQTTNTTLDAQVAALRSTNATLNSQVGTLQANLNRQTRVAENLQEDAESLRQDVQALRSANASLNNQLVQLMQRILEQ